LAILLVVGLVVDLAALAYTEARTQDEVNSHTGDNLDIEINIRSFPFILRLLVSGQVQEVSATAKSLSDTPVPIDNVQLELHDVRIDTGETLQERRLILESIGSGKVSAELSESALSTLLGVEVSIADGTLEVEVAGQLVPAQVTMQNGVVTVQAAGVTLPGVTIPNSELLPCRPDGAIEGDTIELSCTFDSIPPKLIEVVNGAAAGA
jgi:hypothetical protein